ncbi:hypothetical protein JCM17823_14380 [Halorubrum gandharaense]
MLGVLFMSLIIILLVGTTAPVIAEDDIDTSNVEIGEVTTASEATVGEQVEISSSAAIPQLPADWSADLEFHLYVDNEQMTTQEISLEDGESVDVEVLYAFEELGDKELYFQVEGEVEREGTVTTQTATVDRTTETRSIQITPETTKMDGAIFTAPEALQDDIEETRQQDSHDLGHQSFVLASDDGLYIVFSDEYPREGVAVVEGLSPDVDVIEHGDLEFETLVATNVEFRDPTVESVTEVYENPDEYNAEHVEIQAHHRSLAVDDEGIPLSTTVGVLVDDPLESGELFGSVGEHSHSALDDTSGDNIGDILQYSSQPRIITTSFETQYWKDNEATVDGIVVPPQSPARDFIGEFQEEDTIPSHDNAPLLYTINEQQDSTPVSDASELSENIGAYEGKVVSLETNLHMNTISSKRVIESSTGTQLPPVDVVLHGGVAWDQAPNNQDDLVMIMGASSVAQDVLADIKQGEYEVTGEVVSTNKIEGDLPTGYILMVYDAERTGDLGTPTIDDNIEQQSLSISEVLEQQADPEVDASVVAEEAAEQDEQTDEEDEEGEDTVEEERATEGNDDQQEEDSQDSNETDDDAPGFGLLTGLWTITGAVYLLKRRVKKYNQE